MVSKELLEKAKKCTSKEELLELAKRENAEVSEDEINALLKTCSTSKELSDEELENVTGGSCYSGDTYAELGIFPGEGQLNTFHPLITTAWNHCRLDDHGKFYCDDCEYSYSHSNVSIYCKRRSEENDPRAND